MSLVAVTSAKGSPGVTQLASALTMLAGPEAVTADLDPIGGDLALRWRDQQGHPLLNDLGLVSYGAALRGGKAVPLAEHLQVTSAGRRVLVGVSGPAQVQGLGPVWTHIADGLAGAGADVTADCGRIGLGSPTLPVLERADVVLVATRPDISSVAHLRERLLWLADPLRIGRIDGVPLAVAVVGDVRDRRSAEDIGRLLASAGLDVPVVGTVAHDPRTADRLDLVTDRVRQRSVYFRSLVDVAAGLREVVDGRRRRTELAQEGLR